MVSIFATRMYFATLLQITTKKKQETAKTISDELLDNWDKLPKKAALKAKTPTDRVEKCLSRSMVTFLFS